MIMRYTNLLFTYLLIIIKVLSKITIKHKTMLKCEVKSNIKIYKKIFYGQAWGPPRPRRPLAFVQPCPMGVTPLHVIWLLDKESDASDSLSRCLVKMSSILLLRKNSASLPSQA